jgi:hypothetical protein
MSYTWGGPKRTINYAGGSDDPTVLKGSDPAAQTLLNAYGHQDNGSFNVGANLTSPPYSPSANTCCFFSSLETLAIRAARTSVHGPPRQRPASSGPLAGFQVIMLGRFWVSTEDQQNMNQAGTGGTAQQAWGFTPGPNAWEQYRQNK